MAAANGKDLAADTAIAVAEVGDDRRDVLGSEELAGLAQEVLGHPGRCHRGERVGRDACLPAFDGERPRESDQTRLRRSVVCLAEVAEKARGGCRCDDASVAGATQMTPGRDGDVEGSREVDEKYRRHLVRGEVVERPVAQDPGVVYDDRKTAELVHSLLDAALSASRGCHAVTVGDGPASRRPDLLAHLLGRVRFAGSRIAAD